MLVKRRCERRGEKEKGTERERSGKLGKKRERITGRVQTDRIENPLLY